MYGRTLIISSLLIACAGLAHAEDTYVVRGKRDGVLDYEAQLTVTPAQGNAVRVSWRELRVDGQSGASMQLKATGKRYGDWMQVSFPADVGARGRLLGLDKGRVLAYYRFESGGKLTGFLVEENTDLPWGYASEAGKRQASGQGGFEPAGNLAFKRVVLCIDGIPYGVMQEAMAQGMFKGMNPPSRMITVYPSLSAISWGRVFDMPAEVGYQVEYYSNHLGQVMGATKKQILTQTMRAETRMHVRHRGIIGHALAYLFPFRVGRKQVRELIHEVREHKGSRTAFLYAYQTDAIAHMEGREKLMEVLTDVDEELESLRAWFRKEHGEELEVVIVSDHGHTLVEGKLTPINEHLEKNGWEWVEEVRGPKQVNFSSAGILSSIALHCQEASEAELAKIVAGMEGVDLTTYDKGGREQFVVGAHGVGRFDYEPQTDRYGYRVVEGSDPLGYAAVYARLAAEGKVDGNGRVGSRDLFDATTTHLYPDAAHRIRLGHKPGGLVQSPANVIVSLAKGYENARGIVKKIAAISPSGRSGTHGALAAPETLGIFSTNFLPQRDSVRPEDIPRLIDCEDLHLNRPSLEVVAAPSSEGGALNVETRAPRSKAADSETEVTITIKRKRFLLRDPVVFEETFKADQLERSRGAYRIPAKVLHLLKKGKKYRITTRVVRKNADGAVLDDREDEVTMKYRGSHQVFD